jgi:CDGSH-type Zn-finger protein
MADTVIIQVLKNGPLLVKGTVSLTGADGNAIPTQAGQPVALCRCGHSAKKPLCDGAHKANNFTG